MSRRPPSPPPDLPGYTVSKLLGSGGFADVFLYEQHLPRRSVAVKVLIPGAADRELAEQFDAEANLMAALSTHPAIVTIHQAGLSADGRPYMVMEYCSRPNLSARYRAERMSIPEVLRIGVRLAGAVETAHRAGILHRDIKPGNVLTTDFGHPVLSDFGISVQSSSARSQQPGSAVGMSIPWTAPEVFAEQVGGDERADVYSLAATLYTLLARRSPFDRPGGPNGSADLIARIRSTPLPPLGRSDVPPNLERVLQRAMDKNRAARYATALDFGRALQQIEGELRLATTPIDVLDEDPASAAENLGESPATRVRALTVIEPEAPKAPIAGPEQPGLSTQVSTGSDPGGYGHPAPPWTGAPVPLGPPGNPGPSGQHLAGPPGPHPYTSGGAAPSAPADPYYQHSGVSGTASGATALRTPADPNRKRAIWASVAGLLVLLLAGGGIFLIVRSGGTEPPPPPPTAGPGISEPPPQQTVAPMPQPVTAGKGVLKGATGTFTWRQQDARPDDYFQWKRSGAKDSELKRANEPRVVTKAVKGTCLQVRVVRGETGQFSQFADVCIPEK